MEYIEHYDEEKDLAFEIPEVSMKNYSSLEELFNEQIGIYHASVLSALYNAIELDLKDVPFISVKELSLIVYLHEREYEEKLEKCLEFFLSVEEYEICSALKKMKSKLDEKNS